MASLWVTGDTHQKDIVTRFSYKNFPESRTFDRSDWVAILGDWGAIFSTDKNDRTEKYILDWMAARPFSWFIILGNHENYDRIYSEFPLKYSEEVGEYVRKPRENIYIAETGEVYNILGKTILVINGANSHDISAGILDPKDPNWKKKAKELDKQRACYRVLGISWWPQEIPSDFQKLKVINSIKVIGDRIDYVFAHDAPAEMMYAMRYSPLEIDDFSKWLQKIWNKIDNPKAKWYHGHHHQNFSYDRINCLYERLERII